MYDRFQKWSLPATPLDFPNILGTKAVSLGAENKQARTPQSQYRACESASAVRCCQENGILLNWV